MQLESAYPSTPVAPLLSLHAALADLRLSGVSCPVLLGTSSQDPAGQLRPGRGPRAGAGGAGRAGAVLPRRALDHDAALIEQRGVELVRRVTAASGGGAADG